ncbi:hypothetical protein EXW32_29980 (plasmid) [Bacillus mycoides]|uniref:Uncharacterized protein n=1 Tax=Bacillus mycoides TaxID=1405 RepID=A0ABC9QWC9_BACMY|nr:hypothetical protein [Bacillus mycoides]EJR29915.1 hypothetical protein III_05684 [Bacillus mycoides]QWG70553.1 hypothetical protein EXW32_29980 [Bacillus mycoides]
MHDFVYNSKNLPELLGVKKDLPLVSVVKKLEASMEKEYIIFLKNRFLKNYTEVTDDEFECLFFELKRYFVIKSIVRNAPMFSNQVDNIWHEMLMFTKDYQKFCYTFSGEMIHHTPNVEVVQDAYSRGWFDWIYLQLFEPTAYTWKIWNGFLLAPMDKDILKNMKFENSLLYKTILFKMDTLKSLNAEELPDLLLARLIELSALTKNV